MGNTKAYHIISVRHTVFYTMYMFLFTYLYKLIMSGYGKRFIKVCETTYIYCISKRVLLLKEAKSLFVPNLFDIPDAIIMHEIELKVLSISIKSTSDLLLIYQEIPWIVF